MLSFPSNPTTGQTSTQNGRSYTYAGGNVWELTPATGSGGSLITAATVAGFPVPGNASSIYAATDSRKLYGWDATNSAYVEFGPAGGAGTDLSPYFVPTAPTNVAGTAGNAQVALTWTASSAISQIPVTDYVVQYSSNSGSTWTTFSDGTSTATSATVTELSNGTAYTFRVAATNGVGTGAYSTASAAVTPQAGDPLFGNVSLLLHMDGSGATFTDSSAYGRAVTANGTVTQSTAQSRWGGSSALFNGASDALSFTGVDLGTSPFVIEFWMRAGAVNQYAQLIGNESADSTQGFSLLANNDGVGQIAMYATGGLVVSSSSGDWTDSAWHHVALVRSGNNIYLYLDGNRMGSGSYSGSLTSSAAFYIGNNSVYGNRWLAGNIDEVRITVGTDRGMTGSTIPVPTAAFPEAVPGTDPFFSSVSLLLHADGSNGSTSFVDSSSSPKTITVNGDAKVSTSFKKFGTGSAAFDGTGDFLTIPASSAFDFGSGDFTIEMWVYRNGSQATFNGLIGWNTDSGNGLYFGVGNANQLRVVWNNTVHILASTAIPDATWTHIALVRNGGTVTAYQDGASLGSAGISGSMPYVGVDGAIGRLFSGVSNYHWNGYIDDVRVTKGHARTITVPTAAFPDA